MNYNLSEITSSIQKKNGTRMFKCNLTGDLYGSYSSGAVRKKSAKSKYFYQLNKKVYYPIGRRKAVIRVMIKSESDRLNLIDDINRKKWPSYMSKVVFVPNEYDHNFKFLFISKNKSATTQSKEVIVKNKKYIRFEITGTLKNGRRFKPMVFDSFRSASMINIWEGSIWGVKQDGKRKLLRRVYN